jgi:hypothetical protein
LLPHFYKFKRVGRGGSCAFPLTRIQAHEVSFAHSVLRLLLCWRAYLLLNRFVCFGHFLMFSDASSLCILLNVSDFFTNSYFRIIIRQPASSLEMSPAFVTPRDRVASRYLHTRYGTIFGHEHTYDPLRRTVSSPNVDGPI